MQWHTGSVYSLNDAPVYWMQLWRSQVMCIPSRKK